MKQRVSWVLFITACFWAFSVPTANAYIDPNSGSMLIQWVVGGVLGAAFAIKMFWRRIAGVFRRSPRQG